ncbi:hypothetical protein HYH03_012546 [Edaphochlamys debaryana]|uniref:Patatin n=1 Tax=Edaphochlamys debaryana TaxID=47281 RepID=A0A835XSG7_9CHLO|nr:hypothetical protein HYH03_012546 [Edaphochlamys debaryana]|eukprot:KAG2488924.1 hypothetical protein HYH03_012546 [Edaphochlamys debaryana]
MGLGTAVDAVYGASAGALSGAYFVTGQTEGLQIYTHVLPYGTAFLNMRNLLHSDRPVMDIDYLIDRVMGAAAGGAGAEGGRKADHASAGTGTPDGSGSGAVGHMGQAAAPQGGDANGTRPLDWEAVLASPIQLKVVDLSTVACIAASLESHSPHPPDADLAQVVASCLGSLRPVLLSDFHDRHELAAALKASAAIPEIAGGSRMVRGRRLVDAAVFEGPAGSTLEGLAKSTLLNAPYMRGAWASPQAASVSSQDEELGATLEACPHQRVRTTLEALTKTTVLNAPYMGDAWRVALSPPMSSQDEELGATLEACPHQVRSGMGAYVLPLYPPTTAGCHPLCLDPAKLRAAAAVGREAMLGLLGPVAAEAGRWSPLAAALEPAAEVAEAEGSFGDAVIYSEAMGQGMRFRP